jgi:hypothetical protein
MPAGLEPLDPNVTPAAVSHQPCVVSWLLVVVVVVAKFCL